MPYVRRALVATMLVIALATSCSGPERETAGTRSGGSGSVSAAEVDAPPCPVAAVPVVASVNPWGAIVQDVAGRCAEVVTIVAGGAQDPHDFEPTVADTARFGRARLVVVNGLGYDAWASRAVSATSPAPDTVDAGAAAGLGDGDNPHLWYSPAHVRAVTAAVVRELARLEPGTRAYLEERSAEWDRRLASFEAEVSRVKAERSGRHYGATEPVADYLADAIGLVDVTPAGYRAASINGSEPAPGDVSVFQSALRARKLDVLLYNVQAEGGLAERLRAVAEEAGVPVVEVRESLPDGQPSFLDWQLDQLHRLDRALAP